MNKTFVVSEIGINHNGSLDIAKKLILAAKESGCDAVKFQKRNIERVYLKDELNKPRESPWGTTNKDQKLGLEFNKEQYDEINKYCKEINIEWFVSCWDLNSIEFMKQYNCPYNKIASAMLTHIDLLKEIARERKLTFIATGMSTIEEIGKAIEIFKDRGCPFILMHTNSQYPCSETNANLKCIKLLKHQFDCTVGYSSHCIGIIDCIAAICMGATVIEKHITLDRAMYGSDQSSSVEPQGFKKMIEYIRCVETTFGNGEKIVTPEEEIIKKKLRRTQDYV